MGSPIALPGARDVRARVDDPSGTDATACVVACPPHPQLGGSRSDSRLRAVGEALTDRDIACCRFDYGPWDGGRGEQRDVVAALDWAREAYTAVGLFGYSFGAGVALCGAAGSDHPAAALAVLAPPATLDMDRSVADCLAALAVPVRVVVGERDVTVDSEPVAEVAREHGGTVEVFPGDHHFVGQTDRVAAEVAGFFAEHLATP